MEQETSRREAPCVNLVLLEPFPPTAVLVNVSSVVQAWRPMKHDLNVCYVLLVSILLEMGNVKNVL